MKRIKKMIVAVNHPDDKRVRFVVDNKFYFPTKVEAIQFTLGNKSAFTRKNKTKPFGLKL